MSSCSVDGKLDPRVVAIVVTSQGASVDTSARSMTIRQAWRADATSARFEVIPVTGIACDEPGS